MRKPAGILTGYLLIFTVVLYLYGLPLEPLTYGVLLALLLAAVWGGLDFLFYVRRYEKLQKLKGELEGDLKEIPRPENRVEQEYQEMLLHLYESRQEIEKRLNAGYEEMMEYYTIWVHQIKTPIAAMRLLIQKEDSPDARAMELELFKIEQYVEMVLGYLRTEDMSRDLEIREYELDHMIRQAVKKYAKMFILNKISLQYEPVNCTVITDEKWLVFALEQILSNALKYTRPGGTVSIYMEEGKEKTLVIADTGIGIAPEDLPRVWEKGFTGRNGRLDKRATGIGLYSVKRVMDRLRHEIYLTSRVGKGTQVHIKLNRKKLDLM